MQEYINIAATILAALGGAGAIILGLANHLGRVWADRLMRNESHKHDIDLERFRNELKTKTEHQLAEISASFDLIKHTHVKEHGDKLAIYRTSIDTIVFTLAKLEMVVLGTRPALSIEEKEQFELERLRVYGYLAMLAPQEVMDAHDHLTDVLLSVVYDGETVTWQAMREAALRLINAMRKDVGINKSPIAYNGNR